MDGIKLAEYLNSLSDGKTLYSFDERSQRVLSINHNGGGLSMTLAMAHNELKDLILGLLTSIQAVMKDMMEDKPAGESNGNGKGNRPE
jgi:hypothetical protein